MKTSDSNIAKRRQNARAEGANGYAARRSALVDVAASLFREKGFEKTTLADIARRAKIDRATLYYYVGSKAELFESLVQGSLDAVVAQLEKVTRDTKLNEREKLTLVVKTLMLAFERNFPQLSVLLQEHTQTGAKGVQKKLRRIETVVRELIERGAKNGSLRSDLDATLATQALLGSVSWAHRWYQPGGAHSADAIAQTFTRLFFEGMRKK